jgi:chlorinating enzyme
MTEQSDLQKSYSEQGYAFPFDILSVQEAAQFSAELEKLETLIDARTAGYKQQLNYPHVIFRFANKIVRHPKILQHITQLLGPDVLIWSATLFIKEPHTQNYVSWHQDLKYWGLDNDDGQVSAWLALGPVNKENGCMQFIPASHRGPMYEHLDTPEKDNVLSRGQEAQFNAKDKRKDIVHVELAPGQVSFHHGKLLHSSAPNNSDKRRVGLAINYISTKTKQNLVEEDFAMLATGVDHYHHFTQIPEPTEDLSEEAVTWHQRIIDAQSKVIYK